MIGNRSPRSPSYPYGSLFRRLVAGCCLQSAKDCDFVNCFLFMAFEWSDDIHIRLPFNKVLYVFEDLVDIETSRSRSLLATLLCKGMWRGNIWIQP